MFMVDGGKKDEADAKCLYVQVCSLKTTTVKNGFDAQKYSK